MQEITRESTYSELSESCSEMIPSPTPKRIELIQLRFRSMFMQLFNWEIDQAITVKSFMRPNCKFIRGNETWLYSQDTYAYVPISTKVSFRFQSGDETEYIDSIPQKAVMWHGGALRNINNKNVGFSCRWYI